MDYNRNLFIQHIDLNSFNLILLQLELCVTAYVAHRANRLQTPRRLIEEIGADGTTANDPPPRCPTGKLKLYVRFRDARVQNHISVSNANRVKVGTSPAVKMEDLAMPAPPEKLLPNRTPIAITKQPSTPTILATVVPTAASSPNINLRKRPEPGYSRVPQSALTTSRTTTPAKPTQRNGLPVTAKSTTLSIATQPAAIAEALAFQLKNTNAGSLKNESEDIVADTNVVDATLSEFTLPQLESMRRDRRQQRSQFLSRINQRRCDATPIYGADLRWTIRRMCADCQPPSGSTHWTTARAAFCRHSLNTDTSFGPATSLLVRSLQQRTTDLLPIFNNFVIFVPAVSAPQPTLAVSHAHASRHASEEREADRLRSELSERMHILHPIVSAMNTQFPDPRLIQYDCGKLQTLNRLLRQLKTGQHRVLIFTQMTRMLDILEAFLNYHGHIYLRLDGTTKVEQRQVLMDRFNNDRRIFVFILSTRSGGVGVNLTGADTVVFYDSDWNPTMDAQAQDRCHRIGQTRDVHIYRLVSEMTIEENILKKANQKRMLGQLAIEGGNFTTDFFKSSTIQDLFKVGDEQQPLASAEAPTAAVKPPSEVLMEATSSSSAPVVAPVYAPGELETALAAAEDEQDVQAAKIASAEAVAELDEFDETIPIEESEARAAAAAAAAAAASTGPELSRAEQEVENLVKQVSVLWCMFFSYLCTINCMLV